MATPTVAFANFVKDVEINYASLNNLQNQIEMFNQRRQEMSGALLAKRLNETQRIFSRTVMNNLHNATTTPALTSQQVQLVNIYGRKATTAFTTPQRIDNTGAVPVNDDTVVPFANGYVEGLSQTAIQNIVRTGGTMSFMQDKEDRALQVGRENYAKILGQAVLNIYEKLSFDVNAYIAASRWQVSVTPDPATTDGNFYLPVVGNYKQIPVIDTPFADANAIPTWLSKLEMERDINLLGGSQAILYGSTGASFLEKRYNIMGANNAQNEMELKKVADFEWFRSMELTNVVPTDRGVLYMIAPGSTAMFQMKPIPTYVNQETGEMGVKVGNDTWAIPLSVGAGTTIFPFLPRLELSVHIYEGHLDSSATLLTPESVLDRLSSMTFYVRCGMHTAKDLTDPNISSIMGYRIF